MYKYVYFWKLKKPSPEYQPVILITGCSSGIGDAIARYFIDKTEYRIVITSREKSLGLLQQNFPESDRVWILPLDVASEESRLEVVQKIFGRWGGVDILINNAGICYRSVLEEMLDRDEALQINTNYLGPVSLIRLLLPSMRKKGFGKIINISSVSGMLAMPTMASYSASKFALEGAMEALWYEARPFGVNVSLVQPGFVRSKSYERVKFSVRSKLSNEIKRPYSDVYKYMIPFVGQLMEKGLATPESIAELVYLVVQTENPPLWVPAAFDAEFFYYLKRWFPRRFLMPFFYFLLPGSDLWGREFVKAPRSTLSTKVKGLFRKLGGIFYGQNQSKSDRSINVLRKEC